MRFLGRVLAFTLGAALLVVSGFLWVIRQQQVMPRLLIQSQRDSRYDFYVITLNGTIERHIPSETLTGLRALSLQRGWLVYGTGSHLYSVRVTGGFRRMILTDDQIMPESAMMRFSQDGSWLAFSGSWQGRNKLFVVPTNANQPAALLISDINWFSDFRVLWSPDNEWLIYNPPGEERIYRIRRSGGTPEKIADGEMVYATVIQDRWILVQHDGLLLVSLDGLEQRTVFPQGTYDLLIAGRINPETDSFMVLAMRGNQQEVYRVHIRNAERERLFQLSAGHRVSTIDPDGKAIIVQNGLGGFYRLTREIPEPEPLTIPALEVAFTFWAEDQHVYFYFFDNRTSGLGFNVARLAPHQTIAELIAEVDTGVVTFSPDQRWAILARYGPDRRSSFLLKKNLETGEIQTLTDPAYHSDFRAWLPELDLEPNWAILMGMGILVFLLSLSPSLQGFRRVRF